MCTLKKLTLPLTLALAIVSTTFGQLREPSGQEGVVQREVWWFTGGKLSNVLNSNKYYNGEGAEVSTLPNLNTPLDLISNYAQRLRGYIHAPVTGEYTFWVSGDDEVIFWLSTDDNKFKKVKVGEVSKWLVHGNRGLNRNQKSHSIKLKKGDRYFIQVDHKQGGGVGYAEVLWSYTENSAVNWTQQANVIATQSATAYSGAAKRAIDGDVAGNWSSGSITHTTNEAGSWWKVELGADRIIDRLEIFNRNKDARVLTRRLSNYRVSVTNLAGEEVYSRDFHTEGGHTEAVEYIETGGVTGAIVKVELLGVNTGGNYILSLAEVKVLGRENVLDLYQGMEAIDSAVLESYAGSNDDQDEDGFPDEWELEYGFDLSTFETGDFGAVADPDGDLFNNIEEAYLGTNPNSANSFQGFLTVENWHNQFHSSTKKLIQSDAFFSKSSNKGLSNSASYTKSLGYSGTRLRGYIKAPESGNYTFWVSARGGAELSLSTDATKYKKRVIAQMGPEFSTLHGIPYSNSNLWDHFITQKSEEIYLEAGQKYFIEVLGQHNHIGSRHLSVAWVSPSGEREVIPAESLYSYLDGLEDLDDDYLPDAWEDLYGLDSSDNGLIDREREGERGDYDGDGLTNREEYVLGTNPTNNDTDGDGVIDGDQHGIGAIDTSETYDYHSSVSVTSYQSDNQWVLGSAGLISETFNGSIKWDFDVPSAGYWGIGLKTLLSGFEFANEIVPASLRIDGKFVWSGDLVYGAGRKSSLTLLTPYLSSGTHNVELTIKNTNANKHVLIQSLRVYKPTGDDSDSNGLIDWVEEKLQNRVYPYESYSRVSPAFIEGTVKDFEQVSLVGGNVYRGLDHNSWYSDITLLADETTNFTLSLDPVTPHFGSIQWQETNVFAEENVTIRKGDSLKLVGKSLIESISGNGSLSIKEDYVLIEDFESNDWNGWSTTGDAFGSGPVKSSQIPSYLGNVYMIGAQGANSHALTAGSNLVSRNQAIGTLESPVFTITHDFIHFLIGGGNRPDTARVKLLRVSDGEVLRSSTGRNKNAMEWEQWNVSEFVDVEVKILVEDTEEGGWGYISCDQFTFSNSAVHPNLAGLTLYEGFEEANWGAWTVTGDAFGTAPIKVVDFPSNLGDVKAEGEYAVSSYVATNSDAGKGTLTSPDFTITRAFIHFKIAGGRRITQERIRLIDANDGSALRTATGNNSHVFRWAKWDVSELIGRKVKIVLEDNYTGVWGNISLDQICFSDYGGIPDFTTQVAHAESYTLASDSDYQIHKFTTPGIYKVSATYGSGQTANIYVNVKHVAFTAEALDTSYNSLSAVRIDTHLVSSDLFFEGGENVDVLYKTVSGGQLELVIASKSQDPVNIVARLNQGGPILGTQKINFVRVANTIETDNHTIYELNDYSEHLIISAPLVVDGLPEGGKVVVTVVRAGMTFLDGSTVKTFTAEQLQKGTVNLQFLYPKDQSGGYCHRIEIYDRDGNKMRR